MKNKFQEGTFLARWLSGELSEEERLAFEASDEFRDYQRIAETSTELRPPTWNKEKTWEALEAELEPKPTAKPSSTRRRQLWPYAAAASLLLLFACWFWYTQSELDRVIAPMAGREQVQLPDGSEVWLNAGSELMFDRAHFADKRDLNLQGEAYFEVQPGSKFTVHTSTGQVRVLGTSFTVYSRKEKIEVQCFSGKVGLSLDEFKNEAVLTPGDRFWSTDGQHIQKDNSAQGGNRPSWLTGESRFQNVNLTQVVEELERQYDITIQYPDSLKEIRDYNGGFPHKDLETALRLVFSAVGYQYRIDQNRVEVFQ